MARTTSKKSSILLINGIDVSKPGEYIDPSALTDCVNWEVSRSILTKRKGTSKIGAVIGGSDLEIMAGREFTREDVKYNVRIGRDNIEYDSAGTWTDITGSALTGTASDLVSTAVPLLSGKRILCISNGVDAIRKWNASGNTADLGGTPPVAKFIQEYKTYLVCANIKGGTDITQRVQWSNTADPETWTGGNSGSLDLVEDGGDITGMSIFGNYLAVHKDRSIYLGYLVSSSAIFRFDRKNTGVGTVAHNSIVNLPTGEQVFLAKDGLRIFNGISAPLIESPINDEIREQLNSQYAFKAWGLLVKEKDEAWIGVPIGDQETGQTIYKFNYRTRTVYKDSRTDICAGWLGNSSSSLTWADFADGVSWDSYSERWDGTGLSETSEQINLSDTSGFTYEVDTSVQSDDGTAIDAYVDTKDFVGKANAVSRWQRMELWAKGGSIKVSYSTDEGSTWTEIDQSPLTLDATFPDASDPDILYFDVVSTKIRFRFRNAETDETPSIKQFIIAYRPREERQ